jgi:hypothetical protein
MNLKMEVYRLSIIPPEGHKFPIDSKSYSTFDSKVCAFYICGEGSPDKIVWLLLQCQRWIEFHPKELTSPSNNINQRRLPQGKKSTHYEKGELGASLHVEI